MLVQAIPAYRLPRDELEREIAMIERDGRHDRVRQGARPRLHPLAASRTRATRPSSSASAPRSGSTIGIPGEDGPGVYDGLSFLKQYNLTGTAPMGKKVAVIGGGNAAIDAARTALRLGAEEVHDPLPPHAGADAGVGRGGRRRRPRGHPGPARSTAPEEIVRDADGNVTGVRCKEMALGDYDKSGRRRPVAGHNPDFVVEADTVIAAIGQWLDSDAADERHEARRRPARLLQRRPARPAAPREDWVFAGGDAVTGPSSVVEAIGAGEKAAVAIDEFLTGANHAFWRRDVRGRHARTTPTPTRSSTTAPSIDELPLEQRVSGASTKSS